MQIHVGTYTTKLLVDKCERNYAKVIFKNVHLRNCICSFTQKIDHWSVNRTLPAFIDAYNIRFLRRVNANLARNYPLCALLMNALACKKATIGLWKFGERPRRSKSFKTDAGFTGA